MATVSYCPQQKAILARGCIIYRISIKSNWRGLVHYTPLVYLQWSPPVNTSQRSLMVFKWTLKMAFGDAVVEF